MPGGLAFRIEGRKKDRSEFIWEGFNNYTAQQVLDASSTARAEGNNQGSSIQDAMEFLEQTITGVSLEADRLYRMAEKRSIARKMVERAASKMNVKLKIKKVNGKPVEFWSIPESKGED
jgi:hypothetical protein